jgi:hypothetical protein
MGTAHKAVTPRPLAWWMTWDRYQAPVVVLLVLWSFICGYLLSVSDWTLDFAQASGQNNGFGFEAPEFLLYPLAGTALLLFIAGLSPLMSMTLPVTGAVADAVALIGASVSSYIHIAAGSPGRRGLSPVWLLLAEALVCFLAVAAFSFVPWALSAGLIRPSISRALEKPGTSMFGRWIRANNALFGVLVMGVLVFVVVNGVLLGYDIAYWGVPSFATSIILASQSIFPACLFCFGWAAVQEDRNGWWALLAAFVLCLIPVLVECRMDGGGIYCLLAGFALVGGVIGEIVRRRTKPKNVD